MRNPPDAVDPALQGEAIASPGIDGLERRPRRDPDKVSPALEDGGITPFQTISMKATDTMNTQLKTAIVSLAFVLLAPMAAVADDAHHKKPGTAAAAAPGDMTDGEVRKVDLEAGKLTLKHADIKSLDMPSMTMVFVVKDKAMLEKLKTGDKIRFKAVNDAGKFTVTEIQSAP